MLLSAGLKQCAKTQGVSNFLEKLGFYFAGHWIPSLAFSVMCLEVHRPQVEK